MDADIENFAWYLNLDAEQELKACGPYAPTRRMAERVRSQLSAFRLLTGAARVVGRDRVGPEQRVLCWCPTPTALCMLNQLGLRPVAGPTLEVLRSTNHRSFSCGFAEAGLERRFLQETDDWQTLLFKKAPASGIWRLKRAFGWAGRGQRRVSLSPTSDDVRWIKDSLQSGGLLREAELSVHEEYSVHGYVDQDRVSIGQPVRFWCDSFGSPQRFVPFQAPGSPLLGELEVAASAVANALRSARYFGPFGVDAFVWREGTELRLNPVSDINARFTLAWSLGMGQAGRNALGCYAMRGELELRESKV